MCIRDRSITNLTICRAINILSIVLERSISGDIYNSEASPSCTLCIDSDLVMGSNIPFIVTASVIPLSARLSTWSVIRDCKGEMKMCIRDRQGRVAKDRRVKPKGEMTIPITRYRDA